MITAYLILMLAMLVYAPFCKKIKMISYATILSTGLLLGIVAKLYDDLMHGDAISFMNGAIVVDYLNFIQVFLISTIAFIVALYSHRYILHEMEEGKINGFYAKIYYVLFNLFVLSMLVVSFANNVIVMWIGLEATTLSTAFLIGFDRHKLSMEAAWKYIIICSVGIVVGLIGINLFLFSNETGSYAVLNWNYLMTHGQDINPNMAKFAFGLIFVGIATKAGLAPMHTWLPDAHSESPSPISAMMSGVLLNLALYFIVRFHLIIKNIEGFENLRYLFLVFGFVSLAISAFSIIRQKNYKRLLAFSSVENLGIIAIGIGIGSDLAIYGAILHSIIHAFGKTLLFLVSGNILNIYGTKKIEKVNNMIKVAPINAILLLLGVLVITGVPPFASFLSEYSILISLISANNYLLAGLYLICLLIVFAGFINVFVHMVFNSSDEHKEKSEMDRVNILPLALTFTIVIVISILPNQLNLIIQRAISIIN